MGLAIVSILSASQSFAISWHYSSPPIHSDGRGFLLPPPPASRRGNAAECRAKSPGWDVKLPGPVNKLYSQVANIHTQLANVYTELADIRTQLANIVWVRRPPGLCAGAGRSVCVAVGFSSGRRANFMPRGDAVWPMGANFAARAARCVP